MSNNPENIDVHFFQIIFSLQTAAMQQMGKIVSPVTGKIERDISMAKTTIDILAMLETKMKGNLTDEESSYISRSLYELRMNFVDESKKAESTDSPSSGSNEKPEEPDSPQKDDKES
jgi:hypothetical protein